jgi:hypothetical protein
MFRTFLIMMVALGCSGCATILGGGGTEEVEITSDPSGADVIVDGTKRGKTPTTLDLSTKESHAIKLKKGCLEHEPIYTGKKAEVGWIVADAIFVVPTLYLSVGIDFATGAFYTFPNHRVSARLVDKCAKGGEAPATEGEGAEDDGQECLNKEYCDGKDNDCDGVIDEGCG